MKKILTTLVIAFLLSNVIYAQSKTSFGINGGLAIPTGDIADSHKMGFGFGGVVIIGTSNPTVGVALGVSYITLPGKTISESGYGWSMTIEFESANLISIFAGPQLGKEKGPYFLPAITANFDEGESRFGLDIGGGVLVPLGSSSNTKLNISAKYSITNLIGKQEGEGTSSVIRILAGINF
jgi:hypothetical protein